MYLLLIFSVFVLAEANIHHVESMEPKVFPTISVNRFIQKLSPRIVHGVEVNPPHLYNYQVGLFIDLEDGRQGFCGGSLISESFVLTAAHCTNGIKSVEVVLGAHRIWEEETTQVRVVSTELYTHELYGTVNGIYDVGLVRLPHPVQLSDAIGTIRLPGHSDVQETYEAFPATLTGWGKASDAASSISEYLQFSLTHVMENKLCSLYFLGIVTDSHICSDSYNSQQVACNGDSGGPLVVDGKQVGVVSFGAGFGCDHLWPTVYTRVTSYLDWIEEHTDVKIEY